MSDSDFHHFDDSVNSVTRFLDRHQVELRTILAFPGVQGASLDFDLAWRDEAVMQTDRLPASLLALAGRLGLGIDLSHYVISEPDAAESAGA